MNRVLRWKYLSPRAAKVGVALAVALLLVVLFGAPPIVAGLLLIGWGIFWAYVRQLPFLGRYGWLLFTPFLAVWFGFSIWILFQGA